MIRINDDLVITGDMRNPKVCLRAIFPTCTGLRQRSVNMRRQDIEIFRGDDLQVTFSVLDERLVPVSVNKSQRLRFWVARSDQGDVVITKERRFGEILFSGGIILMGDNHRLRLQIDSIDTENLAPGTYYWELELFTNNLKTATTGFGNFVIRRDLINAANDPSED